MHILKRLARICKADIHGLMDRLEDKDLLLKQYLRDMAAALLQNEVRQKQTIQSRYAAVQKVACTNQEIEKIEQDLEVALRHNKDNIAPLLIKKMRPLIILRTELQHHVDVRDREIALFQESIDQQRQQYEQLKQQAADFFNQSGQTEVNAALPGFVPAPISQELSNEDVELELMRRKDKLIQNYGGTSQ